MDTFWPESTQLSIMAIALRFGHFDLQMLEARSMSLAVEKFTCEEREVSNLHNVVLQLDINIPLKYWT